MTYASQMIPPPALYCQELHHCVADLQGTGPRATWTLPSYFLGIVIAAPILKTMILKHEEKNPKQHRFGKHGLTNLDADGFSFF